MGDYVIKLPDVGEGVAEAELVEWHVALGDLVREDTVLAAVMTDKATVEIPSPVDGEVVWIGAAAGDTIAIGSAIVRLRVAGEGNVAEDELSSHRRPSPDNAQAVAHQESPIIAVPTPLISVSERSKNQSVDGVATERFIGPARFEGERPLASPSVRLRAKEAGIDLRQTRGSGPIGQIRHEDLDDIFNGPTTRTANPGTKHRRHETVEQIKLVGLRRKIAEKMRLSATSIPHITYVEEVDVTALEDLRLKLNAAKSADGFRLTILPFMMKAIVLASFDQPQMNALFDDKEGIVHRHSSIHIGIATQTPLGLTVPVVKNAESRSLWNCAAEIGRLAEAARAGSASREELSGSTITVTSLGALGGLATTPIINHPEVAIVGINKIAVRPIWDGANFTPRKIMNISSSFDHRVIDGWDAAVFIQRIKALLESPALLFLPTDGDQ